MSFQIATAKANEQIKIQSSDLKKKNTIFLEKTHIFVLLKCFDMCAWCEVEDFFPSINIQGTHCYLLKRPLYTYCTVA